MNEPISVIKILQVMRELIAPSIPLFGAMIVSILGLRVMTIIAKAFRVEAPLYDADDNEILTLRDPAWYASHRKTVTFQHSFWQMNELGKEELYSLGGDL